MREEGILCALVREQLCKQEREREIDCLSILGEINLFVMHCYCEGCQI